MKSTGTICKLCGKEGKLCQSHIIPKFIFRQEKATSATGYLRYTERINQRQQDGEKKRWLCTSCETRLNEWETQVANKIYLPWCNEKPRRILYGDWMLKFAVSVSWRATLLHNAHQKLALSKEAKEIVSSALSVWRSVLLGEHAHPEHYEQHIILTDMIQSGYVSPELPPNFNRFMSRGCHINMAMVNKLPAFIYVKMGKMTILGFFMMKHKNQWRDTKIHVKEGVCGDDISLPRSFFNYLIERAKVAREEYSKLSKEQHRVIRESIEKDPDKAANSELFEALQRDCFMFGKDAFSEFLD